MGGEQARMAFLERSSYLHVFEVDDVTLGTRDAGPRDTTVRAPLRLHDGGRRESAEEALVLGDRARVRAEVLQRLAKSVVRRRPR